MTPSINSTPVTRIDEDACTGCGLCVKVCPSQTLSLVDGKARVTGPHSLRCGHCAAVCPEDAVRVDDGDTSMGQLASFDTPQSDTRAAVANTPSPQRLLALLRKRRSCRVYKAAPVSRALLEDLIKIGVTAPSGTNCQPWFFHVLPHRAAVEALGRKVAGLYKALNWVSSRKTARAASKLLPGDPLGSYYREFFETVEEGLRQFESQGRDRLFHGAPACILVGAAPGASTPRDDALLATQNILLAAEALGLGTCLIGLAVEAIRHDPRIRKHLGLGNHDPIHAVIALGHPKPTYLSGVSRRRPPITWHT